MPDRNGPATILVVEEDGESRTLLVAVLEQAGYRVEQAGTVAAARERVAASLPDLVLLDVELPDGDGLELCAAWRDAPATAALPVLLVRAPDAPEDSAAGFAAGAVDYLTQPVNPVELRARIATHLELRRHRQQLQLSEARYRSLFEEAPLGIAVTDAATGVVVDCNAEFLRLVGRTRDAVVGQPQHTLHPPQEGPGVTAGCRDDLGGTALRGRLLAQDGQVREVEVVAKRLAVDGRPHWIRFFRDLTERLGAEEALVDSERRLGRLLATAAEGVWILDRDGRTTFVNAQSCELLGYSAEELLGHSPTEFMESAEADKVRCNLARRREGVPGRDELKFTRKDGNDLWVMLAGTPVMDAAGAYGGTLAMFTDITDLKRARAGVERLGKVVEQAAEHIVITDTDGTIVYVNPAFERVTGYPEAEVLGQNPRILKSGEQGESFYRELWQTISAGQVWSGKMANRRKDGTLFREEATISPVRNGGGRIVNYVAVKRDITAELELEEQYRQSQKMEAVGQLASGVAHDFNNLLMVILGSCDLLLEELPADAPLKTQLAPIRDAGERAAGLTRQLLAFSRKQLLQPQVLQPRDVLEQFVRMLGRLVGEDVRLTLEVEDGVGSVYMDQGQLEQVLLNLAVNARDAMPRGGLLRLSARNQELDGAAPGGLAEHPGPGEYVLLEVADSGAGMDAATCRRIFEPFFTTKQKGKGLGLATVYGIVKQSGGFIYVGSAPGEGTRFRIYLPRWRRAARVAATPAAVEVTERGTGTILVVEDEAAVRELICDTLAGAGYQVLSAADGREAVTRAASYAERIDLVLSDVVLPELSGTELVAELRLTHPGLRVLYISGYPDETIARHGVLVPEVAFLQKPFTRVALRRAVAEVLRHGED